MRRRFEGGPEEGFVSSAVEGRAWSPLEFRSSDDPFWCATGPADAGTPFLSEAAPAPLGVGGFGAGEPEGSIV